MDEAQLISMVASIGMFAAGWVLGRLILRRKKMATIARLRGRGDWVAGNYAAYLNESIRPNKPYTAQDLFDEWKAMQ